MIGNEIVLKKDLSTEDFNTIKKALIIKNPKFQNSERYNSWKLSETPEYIQFFKEERDRLLLPRNTLKTLAIDAPSEVFCSEGQDAEIKFFGSLRDYQEEFTETVDFTEDDMIWNVPAGHGKTILTLWHLAKVKKKAIIFVNTNFLVKQWFNRIRDFSQEKALCLSSKINNLSTIEDSNIIITTIQT